jgi:hypothetical protein
LCAYATPTRATDHHTQTLQQLLGWQSQLWSTTHADTQRHLANAGITTTKRDPSTLATGPFAFQELSIHQSTLNLTHNRPTSWRWTIYDHQDQGLITPYHTSSLWHNTTNTLHHWASSNPIDLSQDNLQKLSWGHHPHILTAELKTSAPSNQDTPELDRYTQAETISITIEPWPPRRDWRANLRRIPFGDVRITGIPMVEQRLQGYCAPATLERLMRYYGIPLSAAKLADFAESHPSQGTNVARMMHKVERHPTMRCRVSEILGFDIKRFERILKTYNQLAHTHARPPIAWDGKVLDLATTYNSADPHLLRQAIARQKGLPRFERRLQASIRAGIPLVWGVVLGIIPEPHTATGTKGGHLRLIIGYNASTREILYSDPWGAGHELKRMTIDDAWTITISAHAIIPRD